MRLSYRVPLAGPARRVAVIAAACGLLAACGGGTSGLTDRLFGASNPPPATDGSQPPPSYFEAVSSCPQVEVRSGTESFRLYERGGENDPQRVRFQAAITETARECRNNPGGGLVVRVGVSGRVIAGPKGGPANITVPVRIAVLRDSTEVVYSKLHQVPIVLAPPTFGENFSFVDEQVTFAVDPAAGYRVFVGFDERGG